MKINNEKKSLFQIIAENLKKSCEKYGVVIPWYIMSSKENNNETVEFFKQQNFFDYGEENIKIFIQEEMPLITIDGKLLLENGNIKEASNGNGSIFVSMKKSGVLENMKVKGIEWIFIGAVDNILLNMVDPLLIGVTINNNTLAGSKTVLKNSPTEKVGVFCRENGKVKVIEYTELPAKLADMKNEQNELLYGESHIMCNLFNIETLEKAATKEMKYHVAVKNIDGVTCYKFEKFIFDAFGILDNITILRGKRENDFAPIKNKEGIDSPKTALELYNNYWKI